MDGIFESHAMGWSKSLSTKYYLIGGYSFPFYLQQSKDVEMSVKMVMNWYSRRTYSINMIMFVKTCFSVTQIIYQKGHGTAVTKKKEKRRDKQMKNKEGGSF